MGPYSHIILSAKLAPHLQPNNMAGYFWGSIIPDIRYLAKMRRDHTHLKQERIKELAACYPHLDSFLLGYQVHCLLDEVDVTRVVGAAFPLNLLKRLLRKSFSQPQMTVLVEMYYLQNAVAVVDFDGRHNEVLRDLEITLEQTSVFFHAARKYFQSHSFDGAISAFQQMGMIENTRVEKYLSAYQLLKRNKLVNAIILSSVKNARLDAHALNHVRASLQA